MHLLLRHLFSHQYYLHFMFVPLANVATFVNAIDFDTDRLQSTKLLSLRFGDRGESDAGSLLLRSLLFQFKISSDALD